MGDKVDDALSVYTRVGYDMIEASTVLAEHINDLEDRIDALEAENERLREVHEAAKKVETPPPVLAAALAAIEGE